MCSKQNSRLNLSVFKLIAGINESKTLKEHVSFKWEYTFHGKKCNSDPKWNNDKCRCECKNPKEHDVCKKLYFELLHVFVKIVNI